MHWFEKWKKELAKVNQNIVDQFELARTGKTGERRTEWRKERATAMVRVEKAMRQLGYSEGQIETAVDAVYREWRDTLGPGWQKALEQNVREYGKETGAALIAIGSALQGIPGIGTVAGLAVGAIGTGLIYGSVKAQGDYAKTVASKAALAELMNGMQSKIGVDPVQFEAELNVDYAKIYNLEPNNMFLQEVQTLVKQIKKVNDEIVKLVANSSEDSNSNDSVEKSKNVKFGVIKKLRTDLLKAIEILKMSIKPVVTPTSDDTPQIAKDEIANNNTILKVNIDEYPENKEVINISLFNKVKAWVFSFLERSKK
jgi:hypothetical protein